MEFDVVAQSLISCIPTSDVEIVSSGAIHIAKVHGDIATGHVLCSATSPDFSCFVDRRQRVYNPPFCFVIENIKEKQINQLFFRI